MFGWTKLRQKLREGVGTYINGDKDASPTRPWNRWYLSLFGWKTVVVLEVQEELDGYYLGYVDVTGTAMVLTKPITSRRIGMKVGHEDCWFFALTDWEDPASEVQFIGYYRTTVAEAKKQGVKIL
jgi:hypothetical protein